jgi:hypothetical protein
LTHGGEQQDRRRGYFAAVQHAASVSPVGLDTVDARVLRSGR